jgi:hypothetical protein
MSLPERYMQIASGKTSSGRLYILDKIEVDNTPIWIDFDKEAIKNMMGQMAFTEIQPITYSPIVEETIKEPDELREEYRPNYLASRDW